MTLSFAKTHNVKPKHRFNYDYETKSDFIKTADLEKLDPNAVYTVRAMYISDSGLYGPAPVICLDDYLVNAPASMVRKVEEVLVCHRSVDLINAGKVGMTFTHYENKYGPQVGIKWVDLKTPDPLPPQTEEE